VAYPPEAASSAANSSLYQRAAFGIPGERHHLPDDDALRAAHHAACWPSTHTLFARSSHSVKHRERGHDHRQSTKHADRIGFANLVLDFIAYLGPVAVLGRVFPVRCTVDDRHASTGFSVAVGDPMSEVSPLLVTRGRFCRSSYGASTNAGGLSRIVASAALAAHCVAVCTDAQ